MTEPRRRSEEEQQLLEKAEKYLPGGSLGGFRAPKELAFVVRGGKGSKIYDMSGNEYIDYLLGSGPMVLGHAHPAVTSAVRDYIERGTTYFTVNEPAILLAEEIVQAVPCAEQVRFASTGTEATFFALRAARAFRKRDKVLKFDGAFHGVHDYAIMEGDSAGEFPRAVRKSAGVPKSLEREVLIAPFNDLEMTSEIIQKHQDELGGVIVEPLQRIIPPKKGFLEGLRDITKRYEIPLIFDEVVTGFRFAYGGAQELYGVVPDLAAFGKIIGGGYPLSAVCGKEEMMRHFHPDLRETGEAIAQTGTLSGNPVAATAGLATLRELKKPGTYEKFFAIGKKLWSNLADLLKEFNIKGQIVGEPPLFEIVFTDREISDARSIANEDKALAGKLHAEVLQRGILKNRGKIYLSTAHTEDDIEKTTRVFSEAFKAILN